MITIFYKLFLRHDKKKSDEKGPPEKWWEGDEPVFQIFVLCHHRAQLSRCTRNRRSEENKKLKTLEELCVLGFLRMITNIQNSVSSQVHP